MEAWLLSAGCAVISPVGNKGRLLAATSRENESFTAGSQIYNLIFSSFFFVSVSERPVEGDLPAAPACPLTPARRSWPSIEPSPPTRWARTPPAPVCSPATRPGWCSRCRTLQGTDHTMLTHARRAFSTSSTKLHFYMYIFYFFDARVHKHTFYFLVYFLILSALSVKPS